MAPRCAPHRQRASFIVLAGNSDVHYDGIGDAMVMMLVASFVMKSLVVVMMVVTVIPMRMLTNMTMLMVVRDNCVCSAASVDDSHLRYRRALEHAPTIPG